MNTIILTGSNKGLGSELKELLSSPKFSRDKKIFISRQKIRSRSYPLTESISLDLSDGTVKFKNIHLDKKSNAVIFINNAGTIEPISQTLETDLSDVERAMHVNFWSPLKLSKHLAIEAQQIKSKLIIINITSGAAMRPINGWLGYCVSKSAIKMALNGMEEVCEYIKLYHFDPGVMDTDMQKKIRSSNKESMKDVLEYRELSKLKQLKDPKNVAEEIVELIENLP
jgi:benzil reductase ((S)-benzoin forming)